MIDVTAGVWARATRIPAIAPVAIQVNADTIEPAVLVRTAVERERVTKSQLGFKFKAPYRFFLHMRLVVQLYT